MTQQEQPEEINTEAPNSAPEDSLEKERDEYKAMAQRSQADLINFRRRVDAERQSLQQNAANNLIVKLLPIADDLHRALTLIPDDTGPWIEGIKMVAQSLDASIESVGVGSITPQPGETFDPAFHEAIHYQSSDTYSSGSIIECVRAGYRSFDRVLRAAQVVVAQQVDQSTELE